MSSGSSPFVLSDGIPKTRSFPNLNAVLESQQQMFSERTNSNLGGELASLRKNESFPDFQSFGISEESSTVLSKPFGSLRFGGMSKSASEGRLHLMNNSSWRENERPLSGVFDLP